MRLPAGTYLLLYYFHNIITTYNILQIIIIIIIIYHNVIIIIIPSRQKDSIHHLAGLCIIGLSTLRLFQHIQTIDGRPNRIVNTQVQQVQQVDNTGNNNALPRTSTSSLVEQSIFNNGRPTIDNSKNDNHRSKQKNVVSQVNHDALLLLSPSLSKNYDNTTRRK